MKKGKVSKLLLFKKVPPFQPEGIEDEPTRLDLRRRFRVGDLLHPERLRSSEYETWQKLVILREPNPKIFDELANRDPRLPEILIDHFQLDATRIEG